jgi:TatD DNase family protein
MTYFDAHNHLQDERLAPWLPELAVQLPALGLKQAVVAGSSHDDWQAVADLAKAHEWVRPSFGVHPWYVKEQPAHWMQLLREHLEAFPQAGVGEIGLDRWIKDADVPMQQSFFTQQLALAAELERTPSIHCLQAWGMMYETLKASPKQPRGFLLHSYGGPAEMVEGFVKLGAYFSISPYFLHPRKAAQLATFVQVIPLDRLLIETDAPDMWPPEELNPHPLTSTDGTSINDPRNIAWMYKQVAVLRGIPLKEFCEVVANNFSRLFGL